MMCVERLKPTLSATSNPPDVNDAPSLQNPAGAANIVADKVTKIFGRVAAIREVNFCFNASMLYVLLGDNGAGKSTLLRMLAGLTQPTSGKIELNANFTREQVGYMGHASLLYDELSGMENLGYFAELQGMGKGPDAVRICERAMSEVGLDPGMKRSVHAYSQGMRQRLSLARAVLHSPKIVLLDEPFSNVDAISMAQMARHLGELRDAGCTVVVITHQVTAVAHTGDEFLTMQLGRIVESRKRAQLRPTEVGL